MERLQSDHVDAGLGPDRLAGLTLRRDVSLAGCFCIALAALVFAVTLATQARAQTAAQITPPTFRPDAPRVSGSVEFTGQPGLEAPAGAELLSVTVSGVTIEGAFGEMAAAGQALKARIVGRPVLVSEVFAAVQNLEAAYAGAGYVLARIVLPAQNLRDGGRLRIVVVDGYIERVETGDLPAKVRGRIHSVAEPLVGRRGLKLGEIERRLLIAGDTTGVALRSALSPGDVPGGTILVVEGRFRVVTGFVATDNTLADSLGNWTVTAGVEAHSALGFGETFYFFASGYPGGSFAPGLGGFFDANPRVRTLAGGVVVPIGTDGLTFNIEGTSSRTTPKISDDFQTGSEFERVSLRLQYPWIRSRDLDVNAGLIFDFQSEEQYFISSGDRTPVIKDRLRILRLAGDAAWRLDSGAIVNAGAVVSFGFDAFGARGVEDSTPDLPLSRTGADADFQKLVVSADYSQTLSDHLGFSVYGRAQTSFGQALAKSEQFGIASFQELSAFDAGTLNGDSGWVARGDLRSPWSVETARAPLVITPYAFAATGGVYLEKPTILEQSSLQASAIGVGIELAAILDPAFSQATLALEFGRGFRSDDLPDENRFNLVASYQF